VSATPAAGRAVVRGRAPAGAVVALEPVEGRTLEPPADAQVMDQYGLAFVPDFVLVRAGQPLQFRSSEDVLHNVRVDESGTRAPVFNVATPPFKSYTHVFTRRGYYEVSCDVHPSMRAGVYVTGSPYAMVAGEDGTFSFADVEPGPYALTIFGGGKHTETPVQVVAPTTEIR
jgi:plastocyanin